MRGGPGDFFSHYLPPGDSTCRVPGLPQKRYLKVSDVITNHYFRPPLLQHGRGLLDGPKSEVLTSDNLSAMFEGPVTVKETDGYYTARSAAQDLTSNYQILGEDGFLKTTVAKSKM